MPWQWLIVICFVSTCWHSDWTCSSVSSTLLTFLAFMLWNGIIAHHQLIVTFLFVFYLRLLTMGREYVNYWWYELVHTRVEYRWLVVESDFDVDQDGLDGPKLRQCFSKRHTAYGIAFCILLCSSPGGRAESSQLLQLVRSRWWLFLESAEELQP